jgi:CRP-like cAMP-binding protein
VRMIAVKKAPKKAPSKRIHGSTISAEELLRELPGAKLITHDAGTLIFREGTKAKNCYVITHGKVQILKRSNKGEDIPLALVKPGEFLGEMAMLSGEKRSASALALTRVKTIVLDHAEFVALLKDQHPFASRLSLQLSTLLATRCHHLLRLIARQPEVVPQGVKKAPHLDVRAVLNRVYTLWAV